MGDYGHYKLLVLEASQRLSQMGHFGTQLGSGGNVSVLIEGEEAIAVTPSGKPYASMREDDICIIDFSQRRIEGACDPSIETPLHLTVYRERPDVNAVVHTHPPFASIFAVLNEPVPALFDEVAVAIGPSAEMVPYGLSGSAELQSNVAQKLGSRRHCYLLQNHGALSIGVNMDKACQYAELLEKTAAIYYRALATGKPVSLLAEPMLEALFGLVTGKQDMEIARKAQLAKRKACDA